jgi:hypothetical protein
MVIVDDQMVAPGGGLPLKYRALLETLADKLEKGRCLIFLGAGASVDLAAPADLPTGQELAKELAAKCHLEWHRYVPLSTTAFYYEFFYTREGLNDLLQARIGNPAIAPSRTIRKLVEIVELLEQRGKQVFIVTTNYDQHFERAYRERLQRDPQVIVYRGAEDPNNNEAQLHLGMDESPEFWRPQEPTTYLYKMHGSISNPGGQGLVVTEEDYINFLANAQSYDPQKSLAAEVRGRIGRSTVLFVGYSLADWNFRVIFKATAERNRSDQRESVAVWSFAPPEDPLEHEREQDRWQAAVEFWGRKKVRVVDRDAFEFMSHLRQFLERPQGNQAD